MPVLKKDYIFKRGSISIPILPEFYFIKVTGELKPHDFLLIFSTSGYFF
ncbi:hypothetical protein KIS4809_2175 [Bacillus sp. ZZV12-4809]|nr:hypothetical protein KIS4809_2175 [Bacillus sp. ZZV12-4809]